MRPRMVAISMNREGFAHIRQAENPFPLIPSFSLEKKDHRSALRAAVHVWRFLPNWSESPIAGPGQQSFGERRRRQAMSGASLLTFEDG